MFSVTGIEDVEQNLAFLTAVWLPPRTGSCGVFKKEARKEFSNPVSKSECLNFGAWPRAERAGSSARFSVPHRLAVNNKIMVMGYQEGSPAKKKEALWYGQGEGSLENLEKEQMFLEVGEKLNYPCKRASRINLIPNISRHTQCWAQGSWKAALLCGDALLFDRCWTGTSRRGRSV